MKRLMKQFNLSYPSLLKGGALLRNIIMKYKQIPPLMGKNSWSVVSEDYSLRRTNLTSHEAAVMGQSLHDGIPWDRVDDDLYCQQFYEGWELMYELDLSKNETSTPLRSSKNIATFTVKSHKTGRFIATRNIKTVEVYHKMLDFFYRQHWPKFSECGNVITVSGSDNLYSIRVHTNDKS